MISEGFTAGDMADIGAEQFLKGFEAGKKVVLDYLYIYDAQWDRQSIVNLQPDYIREDLR